MNQPDPPSSSAKIPELDHTPSFLETLIRTFSTGNRPLWLVLSIFFAITVPFLGSMGFFDPWETHYGEVARQMAVRDDYLYPFWKDAYFFSKPILLFWLTAPFYSLLGMGNTSGPIPNYAEFFGRLPSLTFGFIGVISVYFAASRLWNKRAAFLSAFVLATTPFWYFLSRQAITDMLYVGPASAALCILAVVFLDDRYRYPPSSVQNTSEIRDGSLGMGVNTQLPTSSYISNESLSLAPQDGDDESELSAQQTGIFAKAPIHKAVIGLAVACLFPQLWEIGRTGAFLKNQAWLGSETVTRLAASVLLCGIAAGALMWLYKKGRDSWLHVAAILTALATLGKGPVALLLIGLVLFLYFVVSGDWAQLKRKSLLSGVSLYLCVALPWYIVMYFFAGQDDDHKTWFQRFVLYDLFGRIGAGVHGDRGTIEYYVKYLSIGLFPWAGLLPITAISTALSLPTGNLARKLATKQERFTLFVTLWCLAFLGFFTLTTTKFHHYIFPVVVPAALLAGFWLDRLLSTKDKLPPVLLGSAIVGTLIIGKDLVTEPWQMIDLYTYHYKSYDPKYYFPDDFPWRQVMSAFSFGAVGILILGASADWAKQRSQAESSISLLAQLSIWADRLFPRRSNNTHSGLIVALLSSALLFSLFASQIYMNRMSQHWSQKWLLQTYHTMKQDREPLISYQMDWKGETFYGKNQDIQIKKSAADLKKAIDAPGRAFVLVQTDRLGNLKTALGKEYEGKIQVVDRSNKKWFLVLVE